MLDLFIAGLPVGAMYALAALGLVVVFRSTGNLDLSLGGVAATAAYCYHHGSTGGEMSRLAAALLALLVAAGCGVVSAVGARLVGRDRPITAAVASLAWGGLLMAGCVVVFGPDTQFVQPWLRGARVDVAGTVLTGHQLLVIGVAVVAVVAVVWVLRATAAGWPGGPARTAARERWSAGCVPRGSKQPPTWRRPCSVARLACYSLRCSTWTPRR